MQVIRADLHLHRETGPLESGIASSLKISCEPWLKKLVAEYVNGETLHSKKMPWLTFIPSVLARWLNQPAVRAPGKAPAPNTETTTERLLRIIRLFDSDAGLRESIIRNWLEMKERESGDFFGQQRVALDHLAQGENFSKDWVKRELRALEILESYSSDIDLYLERMEKEADWGVGVAARVFDFWIHEKLKSEGFSFRLILNRTSKYRVAPAEACRRLDCPDSTELRLVRPYTILSACLIAYLALSNIKSRVHDWVEAVDLIDRLAFIGALTRIVRCEVCGHWIYAFHSTRAYCGDACRYKLWAKTEQGRERRRKASAAYRKRFNDQVRKAAPNVKRGQRNH